MKNFFSRTIFVFLVLMFFFPDFVSSHAAVSTSCESMTLDFPGYTALVTPGNITVPGDATFDIAPGTYTVTWSDGFQVSGVNVPPCAPSRIYVTATLNGQPWSGNVNYSITGPNNLSGASVPSTFTNGIPDNTYALNYLGGGPAGAIYDSTSPPIPQLLQNGFDIAFNFNFTSNVSCGNGVIDAGEDCDVGPLNGLIAWWKFDENSGTTAVDSSGNGNTGTLANGPIWTDGKIGQALNFDGANDYVDITANTDFGNLPALTVSAWIYPRSQGGSSYGQIASNGAGQCESGPKEGWTFGFNGFFPGRKEFCFAADFGINNLTVITNKNTMTFNEWQHMIVTWDGSGTATNVRIYRNGSEVSYATQNNGTGGRVVDTSKHLAIGSKSTLNSFFFDGIIDDVRIYNRVLSATEIANLNSQDLGGATCSSLGFSGGALSCNAFTCRFDTSQCISNAITASCSAFPTSINVGESSRWTAFASGGTGGPYTYTWSGTDNFSGITNSPVNYIDHTYLSVNTSPGHSASVNVSDGSQSKNATCSNTVQGAPVVGADLVGRALGINGNRVPGQAITFSGDVFNLPGKNTSGPSTSRICIDNANCLTSAAGSLGEFPIQALSANTNSIPFNTSNTWIMTLGTHTYYVCADIYGTNSETDETNNCGSQTFTATECSNGVDDIDPEDTLADTLDPGCHEDANVSNPASYNALDDNEANSACSDPFDNDGDGANNCADPGCHTDYNYKNSSSCDPTINNEFYVTQCEDVDALGAPIDNDGDGKANSLDPGCHWDGNVNNPNSYDKYDNSEGDLSFREVFESFTRPFASLFGF